VTAPAHLSVSQDASEIEWNRFVNRQDGACGYHLWGWRRVFSQAFGLETNYLACTDGGTIVGVLPIVRFDSRLFGRFAVSLPFVNYGGVLAADDGAARLLLEHASAHARSNGAAHLELRHRDPRFSDLPVKRHKVAMRMHLEKCANIAWNILDRKVRNQIKKAQKSGLTASIGGRELLDEFYAVFAENKRDLGTPVYSRLFFDAILREFPESTRIIIVRHGGAAAAAGLSYSHGNALEVPWAGSIKAYRSLCSNNLLYWTFIEHAIAQGFDVFDFGRSTPGEGTFNFKRQWGAEPSLLAWEYDLFGRSQLPNLSTTNAKFRLAIALWKRLPVRVTTLVGPAIVRAIP
jgi:serine/alanine adding enzyme